MADVNGDGKADLVIDNEGSRTVSVLLGNGDGTFTPTTPLAGIASPNTPYEADLTGDGIADGVVLDSSGNILFRQGLPGGDNAFAPPMIINVTVDDPTTGKTEERTARDLTILRTHTGMAIATADAIPDPTIQATENRLVYSVSVYTDVNGSFRRPGNAPAFTTSLLPTSIVAGDLTGDGLDDLVVADAFNNSIQVSFQQANGTFSQPLTLTTDETPSDIALVDVNGDGLLDIVVTNQVSGDVTVLLNDATHSFTQVEQFRAGIGLYEIDPTSVTSLTQSVSLTAGDFTGNGRNDLVVVNRNTHSFSLLLNDGNGGFADPSTALTTSTSDGLTISDQPGPIVSGYFQGTNKPLGVAILMEDLAQVWVYTNDGQGHFTLTFTVPAGTDPTGLTVVRDPVTGFDDLLVGDSFGDVLRLQGNGDGTFHLPLPLTGNHTALDVTDIVGTGQELDALVANQQDNLVTVQAAPTAGTQFSRVQTLTPQQSAIQLAPGDVNARYGPSARRAATRAVRRRGDGQRQQ